MNPLREQFGVVVLWIFRADHDVVLSINQWIAGVIGGILSLVTGKLATAQQSNISNSSVKQVVETPPSTETK